MYVVSFSFYQKKKKKSVFQTGKDFMKLSVSASLSPTDETM